MDPAHPLLLVLDDFHAVTDPLALRFIEEFLAHLPGHVHLMIASRTKPSLTLSRLAATAINPLERIFTAESRGCKGEC